MPCCIENDAEAQIPVDCSFQLQRKSQRVVCPKCREEISTEIHFEVGRVAIGFCVFTVLFLVALILIVCLTYLKFELTGILRMLLVSSIGFLFLILDCTLDAAHYCPNCKRLIGKCAPCRVFSCCG